MTRLFVQFLTALLLTVFAGLSISGLEREPAYANESEPDRGSEHDPGLGFEHDPAQANEVFSFPAPAYPDHIPGPYTGGFDEPTCHSCHFDYEINDERGSLTVDGLGATYVAGERYEIVVSVESERLGKAGFQMTARFEEGSQAGKFEWSGNRLTFTPETDPEIQYIQHSLEGTAPTSERQVSWSFVWKAPRNRGGPVIFHVAANAGNDDFSAFGDWIYVEEIVVSRE